MNHQKSNNNRVTQIFVCISQIQVVDLSKKVVTLESGAVVGLLTALLPAEVPAVTVSPLPPPLAALFPTGLPAFFILCSLLVMHLPLSLCRGRERIEVTIYRFTVTKFAEWKGLEIKG